MKESIEILNQDEINNKNEKNIPYNKNNLLTRQNSYYNLISHRRQRDQKLKINISRDEQSLLTETEMLKKNNSMSSIELPNTTKNIKSNKKRKRTMSSTKDDKEKEKSSAKKRKKTEDKNEEEEEKEIKKEKKEKKEKKDKKKKKKEEEEDIDLEKEVQFIPKPKSNSNPNRVPFKRIDDTNIKYQVPENLRDNSYAAFMKQTGDDFGKAANDKLIVTRGKGFRKEKTKFKNKTFHGGMTISTTVRSIPLEDDYSSDEK